VRLAVWAGADQGGGAQGVDLGGQRGWVRGGPPLADRLADELLYPGERVGGLRGPAPLACWRGIGDGLQLAQGVSTAKLVVRDVYVS
jgi:hypothetical protein